MKSSIFKEIFEKEHAIVKSRSLSKSIMKSNLTLESYSVDSVGNENYQNNDNFPLGPQDEFQLQQLIRPIFGKEGINNYPIGTHPDFIDLEGSDIGVVKHYVCTLFVDIKGSTRLSLLYSLEDVFNFKNAVIKTCVEAVRSFDGHVHRLMGDAVMAFFGGKTTSKEDAIINAINCSIALRTLLEYSIRPWMESQNFDAEDFGFRVGLDFGNDDEVLWGYFGYSNVGEVSATGLPVDMASKLQGLAEKNQTMIGQGALSFVSWPQEYSKFKLNSEGDVINYVTPNLTNKNGTSLNYEMMLLDYKKCLKFFAFPVSVKAEISTDVISNEHIEYECYVFENDEYSKYISGSRFLDKGLDLRFDVVATTRSGLNFPLTVMFVKTNHGIHVPLKERDKPSPIETKIIREGREKFYSKIPSFSPVSFPECTEYRGLHTMKCEVRDARQNLIFRNWIAVTIK